MIYDECCLKIIFGLCDFHFNVLLHSIMLSVERISYLAIATMTCLLNSKDHA